MSRSKFKIKGLNQEKTLNSLSKAVKIYNLTRNEDNLSQFEIEYSDRKKAIAMLKQNGVEVEELGSSGILWKLKEFLKSYGIIIGIIVSCLFYFVQYNFILKIEVWGIESQISSNIEEFALKNLSTRYKNAIDTEKIELSLKGRFKEISSISVAVIGQTLVINVNPSILPPEMESEFLPIVCAYNGQITQISLIQGTLKVAVGDIVKVGDVLVEPYIIASNGEERAVMAKAEIIADVWISQTYNHYDYQVKTARTGNKKVANQVLLWNKVVYQHSSTINFDFYEEEKSIQTLTRNNLLPFKVLVTTYHELETIEINKPFEENKEEIIDLARQKALLFLQENEIIKEESFSVREGGACHIIDYTITTNKNIGG